jgi:hypothetical protein
MVAVGMFTGSCAMVDILMTIAEFTGNADKFTLSPSSKEVTTYQLYIALACFDFVLFLFSILLIYGNERSDEMMSRNYLLPWAILIPFIVVFESGANIHYFYYQFNDKFENPLGHGTEMGYVIVPLVYWIIKDIIEFICFMFVVIRIQYLTPSVRYVRQIDPCHECSYTPAPAPVRMALPQAPSIPRPAPPLPGCTSCSGGFCNADRCRSCTLPQPMYGYAGFNTGNNVGRTNGWTTSIYNTGGF